MLCLLRCWRCGKEIDGYRHFRTGECILFDEAEILRWEEQWEEMEAAARVAAAGVRNEYVGETAARQGRAPRGCFCPQVCAPAGAGWWPHSLSVAG